MEAYRTNNVVVTVNRNPDTAKEATKEEVIKRLTKLVTGNDPVELDETVSDVVAKE